MTWALVSVPLGTRLKQYPYSPQRLRSDNPGTSYPAVDDDVWLAREGVVRVAPTEPPASDITKIIMEGTPRRLAGVWTQQWVVTDAEPPTVEDLVAHAKAYRKAKEFGGITIAGVPVETDERAQGKIQGARIAADANPNWTTVWSGADDESYPLDAAAVVAISDAVLAHVNKCFIDFSEAKRGIRAGEITTYAQVEEAFA